MQAPYLSVNRYLRGGYGIDTSSLTRSALRTTLMRASSTVNTWCSAPQVPSMYDFRGGSVVKEQHPWPIPSNALMVGPGTRRVYPNHKPVIAVSSFVVKFTNNYQVTLDAANDLYVNSIENYAEVVAVAAVVTGIYPVGINFGLYAPVVELDYTYGRQYAVTGDELEAESPLLYTAAYGNWKPGGTVAVQVNGSTVSPSDYTVNADDGSVLFDSSAQPAPNTLVTADYTYLLPDAISQATGLIATDMIAKSRLAARGMIGLSSLKVAEISLSVMQTRNGVTIPDVAAALLGGYVFGSAG